MATAAVLAAGLAAGGLAASAVDGFLAVDFRDKQVLAGTAPQVPVQDAAGTPTRGAGPPAQPRPAVLDLPSGLAGDPLLALAASRFPSRGADPLAVRAVLDPAAGLGEEGYRIDAAGPGDGAGAGVGVVTVTGCDRRGLAQGLFRLADEAVAGTGDDALRAIAGTVVPAAAVRLLDAGAAGVPIDRDAYAAQTDYGHVLGFMQDALLGEAPWVDPDAMSEVDRTWRELVDHAAEYGYNGIVVPGFLEYVTFSGVDDGDAVYPPGAPQRERALAMREATTPLWSYAADMGVDVVMATDMLALTSPLEDYLRRTTGGLDPTDPRLWQVYRAGVEELLREVPAVHGLLIRIGEAGGIYNTPGWDYYSRLAVTRPQDVRSMLDALTAAAEPLGATIIFRTWSVGVGEIGDLHTDPDTYREVLGPGSAPGLVVSTKIVAGDFDSYLPLNPTLEVGDQQRIMEVQARREFEGFSAWPNVVSGDTQAALQQVRASTGRVPGLWVWAQNGGPQRAGPMTLYLREGFWQLWDLDVWLSARLAWDPDTDLGTQTATWIRRTWSDDPDTVADLGRLLAMSRQATLDGLYIRPYAEQEVRAFGLEPPPMMWIFKWDLVSGDTASWSGIEAASRGRVGEAVRQADEAVAGVDAMSQLLAGIDRDAFHDPAQYDELTASLEYERDLFATLGDWRRTALDYYTWADTGSPAALADHRAAADRYAAGSAAHTARWSGNVALPPYVFTFADTGLAQMRATAAATWTARAALVLAVLGLVLVRPLRRAAVTPWLVGPLPWRSMHPGHRMAAMGVPVVVLVAGQSAFSGFGSWLYLALGVGLPLAGAAAAVAVARLAAGRSAAGTAALAACGAHLLAACVLPAAVSSRGHLAAWHGFWVDPAGRTAFVVTAVTALVWLVAVPVLALVGARRPGEPAVSAAAAAAVAIASVGMPLVVLGVVSGRGGLERFLTTLNDQLVVLPNGLSRILGITVHLGIPATLPAGLVEAGSVLVMAGLVVAAGAATRRARA